MAYFENELSKLPVEKLWSIIEELISSHPKVFDKNTMNYDDVLELCVVLKASDEMFRNLEQICILRQGLDSI